MIITMAGKGRRFREVGITIPKYMIKIGKNTMFTWAMLSLEDFFGEDFIFIAQEKDKPSSFIEEECKKLGINVHRILQIQEVTDGQATTAYLADSVIEKSDAVIVYNIDTYVEKNELFKKNIAGDGFIPVFRREGTRWSFVKANNEGIVTAIAEKKRISNLATIGFYYFDRWEYFVKAYTEYSESIKNKYHEKYVAPLYEWMIKNGLIIKVKEIGAKKVHVLGTPEDISQFECAWARDKHL